MERIFITLLLVSVSFITWAQSGPAGVGSSSNNIIWLDADDIGQSDGTDVTTWADKSGNTVSFIDTGSGNPPSFQTGEVNGLPVVEFDDTNAEHLVVNPYNNMASGDVSTIIVFATANNNEAVLSYAVGSGNASNEYLIFDSDNIRTYVEGNNNAGGNFQDGATTFNILTSTWTSSTGALRHYKNSTNVNTANISSGSTITNGGSLAIGGEQDQIDGGYASGQDFGGKIAEIIMFNTEINDGERVIIENYLSEKYGITISQDYFGNYTDYDAGYDDDLRGIGTGNGTDLHDVSGFSSGLQLEALSGLDNTNEFVLLAHDASVSHADNITTDLGEPEITDRWQKDFFVEASQDGVVDDATVNAAFTFDFSEAGLTYSGSPSDYVLLYRATTSDNFTRVFANSYSLENGDQIVVDVPTSRLQSGYYTLGRGTQLTSRTWYVLQNGDWSDSDTWTLDAGTAPIPNNPMNETPGNEDDVIIRNGKTVTIQSTTNNLTVASITVDGSLDITTSSGHDFNIINGQGTISMSGSGGVSNFPDGSTTTSNGFGNPANGGLLIVEDALEFDQDKTFKDLRILTDAATDVVALGADLTINGDLNVRFGTLQFGDGTTTNRTLTVIGDFSVESNGGSQDGRVTTAVASNTRHEFDLYGDFLNEGDLQFSDRDETQVDFTSESTNGVVDLNLVSTNQDQRIDCNGLTKFYRIEIVKNATDFVADIQADDPGNFFLTGPADYNIGGDVTVPADNQNALGLITGTVSLGTNLSVRLNTIGNYSIGTDAKLVVSGGEVTKTGGAAITPYGIIEVTAGILEVPSGSGITTRGTGQINISGGEIWATQIRTSVLGAEQIGGYQQTGGTTNLWSYDASESPVLGQAAGSANNDYARFCLTYEGNAFTMTGGTLNVKDATNSGLIFINSDPANINVQGGRVNVYSSVSGNSEVASRAPFWDFNVINESASTDAVISSETLTCGPGGSANRTITDPDLKVLNDLTIETGTTRSQTLTGDPQASVYGGYLDLCPGNNCVNLEVGKSLFIEDSGVLDVWAWDGTDNDGSATVTFNGQENGEFYVGDITTYTNSLVEFSDPGTSGRTNTFNGRDGSMIYWELPLYNWVIDKPDATLFLSSKLPGKGQAPNSDEGRYINTNNGGKNVTQYASNLIKILNSFELLDGTLNQVDPNSTVTITEDNGGNYGSVGDAVAYSIRLYGQVTNEGTCFVYEDGVTPKEGIIVLRKDAGNVTLNTVEGASFGNFRLLIEPDVVFITSDLTVGRLEVVDGIMDIGTHNLKVDVLEFRAANAVDQVASGQRVYTENHHIRMAGNASDGGLSVRVPRSLSTIPDLDEYENLDNSNLQDWNREYNQSNIIWYPIGTNASGSDRYTPAIVYLHDNGTTDGDEYITVRVVDGELQTTDLSGGDILSHYWNVDFEGYAASEEPTVSWLFQYDDADVDAGDETNYVPGKVLDSGSYTRSDEGGTNAVKDGGASTIESNLLGNDPANVIVFNGLGSSGAPDANDDIESATPALYNDASINTQWQDAWPGTGFALENANYTAGVSTRFIGNPTVYYSRRNSGFGGRDWDNNSSWYDSPTGTNNPPDFPGAGDIAVIRGNNGEDAINVSGTQVAAQVVFEREGTYTDIEDLPRLRFAPGDELTVGTVSGVGDIYLQQSTTSTSQLNADIGLFAANDTSLIEYYMTENGTYNVQETDFFTEVPTLRIYGQGANYNRIAIFEYDLQFANLIVDGEAVLEIGGNYDISNRTRLGFTGGGRIRFSNGAEQFTISTGEFVTGRGKSQFDNDYRLEVETGGGNGIEHVFEVRKDIALDFNDQNGSLSFDLFTTQSDNNVILRLSGNGSHALTDDYPPGNSIIDLYKIELNKGTDVSSTFSLDANFTIPDATTLFQPIEVINGLLIFNNSINGGNGVVLANESNFLLPNTANPDAASGSGGLEIAQGIARIEGDDTGMILDGLLRISGGTLDMSDDSADNGNNFIQYGASDQAVIEITNGSLLVGSQVRRPLSTDLGFLNYTQTGGIARFGITAAPESTRGVFELLNDGSEFTHTAGEFTVVRENGSSTVGSLIIKPDPGDLDVTGSTITIGSADTPANQNDIGIDADVPLNNLTITGNNSLTAKIFNTHLEIADFTVQSGGTFDANGFDFTINGDFLNDGTYNNSGTDINQQTTFFPSASAQDISGSGISNFFNVEKDGAGTLTASKDITIQNDLNLLEGTVSTGTNAVNVEGDMMHDAIHTSDPAGPGIVFNGSDGQNLDTTTDTGEFGVMTLNNANGLEIPGDGRIFQVNDMVVLETGIFNIGGNLLIMSEDAVFDNGSGGQARTDFNANRMISVNASITDNGVRKIYNDSYTGTYLYPVGLNFYTPAEVNVTGITGGNTSQITIKPIEDIAGGIPDDTDETCNGADYVDLDNILQFYWLIRSANVTDFDGSIFLYHVDDLEAVDNTQGLDLTNYAPARLLDNSSTWDKAYSEALFDEVANLLMFQTDASTDYTNFTSDDIAGTYTAGITRDDSDVALCGGAIPDAVPVYTTNSTGSGDVDDINAYNVDGSAPGGTPPALGESPDLVVAGSHELTLTNQFWRFRRVTIESGATLTIQGAGVNLGTVDGEGTLKLINTNALPAGDYADFEADAGCTTGGGFEMEVTTGNSVDLALPFNRLRRLILTGDGEKVVTNGSIFNICENLEILDAGTLTMGDNTTFNIRENIIKDATASFDGDFIDAEIVMEGSAQQQIDGDFTGTNQFKILELDNSSGLTVVNTGNDDIEVEDLIMTDGKIFTDADNTLIILNTGSVSGNFDSDTFVEGPLIRRLETTTDTHLFPVGEGTTYLPIEVSNTLGYGGTKDWTARFYDENPTTTSRISGVTDDYDFSTYNGEVATVNSQLYEQDLWEVDVASPATADVRPYWDSDTNVGADENDWQFLRVMVWNGTDSEWESYGNDNANYTGMTTSFGSVVSANDLSFSNNFVTLGSIGEPVSLPVDLVYFSAVAREGKAHLEWQTATEKNNDYFEVQRSRDGETFEVVSIMDGAGDSDEPLDYSYVDENPYYGVSYYRIRQVDFDGQSETFPAKAINNDDLKKDIDVFLRPNPTTPENINISVVTGDENSPIYVKMVDINGQVVVSEEYSPTEMKVDETLVPGRSLSRGLYFITVVQGDNIKNMKLLIR